MLQRFRYRKRALVSILFIYFKNEVFRANEWNFRDPRFIRAFKSEHCVEVFAEHLPTKKKCVYRMVSFVAKLMLLFAGKSFGGEKISPSLLIRIRSRKKDLS
jgi:hypothetical protein